MNSLHTTKSSISRMLATVLVAAGLALCQTANAQARDASASAPIVGKTTPVGEDLRVLAKQGTWSVVRNAQGVAVTKQFDDGAKFAIIRTKEGYGLAFMDPNWSLREGQTFKFSIDIDGKSYSGQGKATSNTMMVATDIRDDFINDFTNGELVKFEIAGSKWTIVPANVNAVVKAATNS